MTRRSRCRHLSVRRSSRIQPRQPPRPRATSGVWFWRLLRPCWAPWRCWGPGACAHPSRRNRCLSAHTIPVPVQPRRLPQSQQPYAPTSRFTSVHGASTRLAKNRVCPRCQRVFRSANAAKTPPKRPSPISCCALPGVTRSSRPACRRRGAGHRPSRPALPTRSSIAAG